MRVLFAGVEIAGWYDQPAKDFTVNGAQVVSIVDIVGAANKRLYARGNSVITVSFSVRRLFASVKEAEVFACTAFDTMTKTGTCEIQCGFSGDYQSVYLYNAVVESSPNMTPYGVLVDVEYRILAASASTSVPPQFLIDDSELMILKGSELIANGATYHDVSFSSSFAGKPVVTHKVAHPSGGEKILSEPRDDLITVSGFRAEFIGAVPGTGNYYLNWIAAY